MIFQKNKRYLVQDMDGFDCLLGYPDSIEVKCLEISPLGQVKLQYLSKCVEWVPASRFQIVEELK